jgi:sugar/nucleoside kinase (ribokinase family)
MKRVLGLGNALVDMLIQMNDDSLLEQLSLPKGSMQLIDESTAAKISSLLENRSIPKASGGSAANTIHGLARLGMPCGFIGKVNDDDLGNFFRDDMQKAGIQALLYQGKSATGRANTFISTDSERTFATFLGAAVELSAEEIKPAIFEHYEIFHVEGYLLYNEALIEQALKLARKNKMMISLDLASYNVVSDKLDFLKRIIPQYIDLVFANEEEAKAYTGKNPEDALNQLADQCEIAVVKIGKKGSLIKTNGQVFRIGIVETKALDTTGAGDQYAAGFIYGLIKGLPFDKCGRLGALLAGKVIEKYGARIYEQDWPEILKKAAAIAG